MPRQGHAISDVAEKRYGQCLADAATLEEIAKRCNEARHEGTSFRMARALAAALRMEARRIKPWEMIKSAG